MPLLVITGLFNVGWLNKLDTSFILIQNIHHGYFILRIRNIHQWYVTLIQQIAG